MNIVHAYTMYMYLHAFTCKRIQFSVWGFTSYQTTPVIKIGLLQYELTCKCILVSYGLIYQTSEDINMLQNEKTTCFVL